MVYTTISVWCGYWSFFQNESLAPDLANANGMLFVAALVGAAEMAVSLFARYRYDVHLVTDGDGSSGDGVFYVDADFLTDLNEGDFDSSVWIDYDTAINTNDLRTLEASNAAKT